MDIFADIFVGALSLLVVLYPLISGKPLRYRPARSSIPWRTVDPIAQQILQVLFFATSIWCWFDLFFRLKHRR